MKMPVVSVLLLFAVVVTCRAQGEMLDNGFSVKFSFGFPPSQYGYDGEIPLPVGLELNNTFGLEIGNQWFLVRGENAGLALDINWLDLTYGGAQIDDPVVGSLNRITLEGSLLEFGPLVSWAFIDKVAVDAYYNLRPTYMVTGYYVDFDDSDDFIVAHNFNFMHGAGLGLRFKFIYLGYEYTFGAVHGDLVGGGEFEDVTDLFGQQRLDGANSKLVVGFQF